MLSVQRVCYRRKILLAVLFNMNLPINTFGDSRNGTWAALLIVSHDLKALEPLPDKPPLVLGASVRGSSIALV